VRGVSEASCRQLVQLPAGSQPRTAPQRLPQLCCYNLPQEVHAERMHQWPPALGPLRRDPSPGHMVGPWHATTHPLLHLNALLRLVSHLQHVAMQQLQH
jgi:hypothetical protein